MVNSKKDVTTIYIIRHGQSESNVYAQENPDKPASQFGEYGSALTQLGREQAAKLAKRLQDVDFAAIYSSDLTRAKETAEIIADGHSVPVVSNSTIRERFFGKHMTSIQKREIEKALETLNEEEKMAFRYFPHGESGYEVVERFKNFLKEIIAVNKNKTIAVVNHGNVMRSFLIHEGFAKYADLSSGAVANCGYFVIQTDGETFEVIKSYGINKNQTGSEE